MLGTATVVALLVAAIWLLPGMLDWNRYRSSIAALVAAGIGRPVQIDGNITLHLLPQPILTASNLKVNDAGDGVVMLVHEVRLRVALGPLLGGRVDARELELRGADLTLPWPPPAGALGRRPPVWITGLQARVEESRLVVGNLVLSGLAASFGSDPETGTLSAAGSASVFGVPTRLTARLGQPGRDGAATLDVSVDGQANLRDTGGVFSGVLAADGGLSGRITARGPDLSQLMPAPPSAWKADGRLSAADGLAVADELALEIGGSPARGAVALRVQPDLRLDLALTAGRLDLDAWAPVLLRSARPAKEGGAEGAVPTGLDLSAEVATLAGGTIRQLRAAFDIDKDGMGVREATAVLPGDARLSLRGRFPRAGRGPLFEGSGALAASDLRTTLRWLEPFAPALLQALPGDALRTGDLTAKVAIDLPLVSLTELHGTLDGAPAQGGLAVRLGPRLGVSGSMSLDRLLLDPWLPDPASLADPAAAYARLGRTLAAAPFDTDLKLQVRDADWRGFRFGPVSLDAQSEAGRLTVRRLEATALGVHATVSGTAGEGGRVSEGRMELATLDVSPLRMLLPADLLAPTGFTAPALLHGPANALVQVSGPPDALAVRATAELNDLRVEAQPLINLPARRWAGPLTLHHPGAPRLLEQLGLQGTAPWLGDGSFSLIAQANVVPGRAEATSFELVAGQLRAAGQLALAGRALSGRVRAETLTLPMIHPRSPDPLPANWLRGLEATLRLEAGEVLVDLAPTVQSLAADLSASHGVLTAKAVTAKLSGGTLAGTIVLDAGEKPRLSVQGQARDIGLTGPLDGGTLDLTAGVLAASVDLAGEGYSPAALTATLSGSGVVTIRDAEVSGIDLPAAQAAIAASEPTQLTGALRTALTSGQTSLPLLTIPFDAKRGVLTVHAAGAAGAGSAALGGTVDLSSGMLEGRLTLQPGPSLPEVAARLTGTITAPVRTPELASVARWLAERP